MTAVASDPQKATSAAPLARAAGVELLGDVHGSGYKEGAALVRRADGQMVQLTPLMYALLASVDGHRDPPALAEAVSERTGRQLEPEHVVRLAEKLSAQGLLAGSEDQAPPRRNPLLALRWKVLVTDGRWTNRLTAPFAFLFRPWIVVPVLAVFAYVVWFVLIHKGVASATAQAFHSPGLLVLVFALAVISAGFHELGHAAACRYGGATPGGMGMGIYMVWPAFYTDVTDSYRLPRLSRLRVDLGGLYFNAVVAAITMGVWALVHTDALLLLVALQLLQMVKQLSPIIRADGYHILSDLTGVPDLYYQMGPTLRRLLPGHRHEPSALTGRARAIVTVWVLIMVPVLLSLSLSAIILLPRLATSAFDSGRTIILALPHQSGPLEVIASILRLLALSLPVLGSVLVAQRIGRMLWNKVSAWSAGRPPRQAFATVAGLGLAALAVWAWWPSGQYRPVRATQNGTLGGLIQLVSHPAALARPTAPAPALDIPAGTHLAVSMIPVGGASARHPALFVISRGPGKTPVAIVSPATGPVPPTTHNLSTGATTTTPLPTGSPQGTSGTATQPIGTTTATFPSGTTPTSTTPTGTTTTSASSATNEIPATAFPFTLPKPAHGLGDSSAMAVNTTNGAVEYDVAYSLVTVSHGAPVTDQNTAYAIANCQACTTVAVSFQVVLVVGHSSEIAPINAAGALNNNCPACMTTAIADQLVISLKHAPSAALLKELQSDLSQLGALPELGAQGTPAAIASTVTSLQSEINAQIAASGDEANPPSASTATSTGTGTTQTSGNPTPTTSSATTPTSTGTSGSGSPTGSGSSSTQSPTPAAGAGTSTSTSSPTTTTAPAPSTTTTAPGATTTSPSTATTPARTGTTSGASTATSTSSG